jgi:universal protein Kae1
MISLGIESTAHTFGVGIVTDKGEILANEKSVYVPKKGSGILPREAADNHIQNALRTIERALKVANLKIENIDLIAFSAGPGMPPCLHVGAAIARYISLKYKKPLVAVNHCIAHIEIGKLATRAKDPVVLYLSGGNTQVIAYTGGKYRIFGETEDIAVGNAFDVLAKELSLKMPGGPEIEKQSKKGKYVELSYIVKGMDVSFTGILTEAIKKFKEGMKKEDVCYSMQETSFAMLTEVTERALAHTDKEEVLLVGGVAVNKRLQEMLRKMCEERGGNFYVVPQAYAVDNGTNIAWTGILAYKSEQETPIEKSNIKQKWRTDEVEIKWIK